MYSIEQSLDGVNWVSVRVDDNSWWCIRYAREHSEGARDGRIFRVVNQELKKTLVAFRQGAPDPEHYGGIPI
jgi:hypothetical protein